MEAYEINIAGQFSVNFPNVPAWPLADFPFEPFLFLLTFLFHQLLLQRVTDLV